MSEFVVSNETRRWECDDCLHANPREVKSIGRIFIRGGDNRDQCIRCGLWKWCPNFWGYGPRQDEKPVLGRVRLEQPPDNEAVAIVTPSQMEARYRDELRAVGRSDVGVEVSISASPPGFYVTLSGSLPLPQLRILPGDVWDREEPGHVDE